MLSLFKNVPLCVVLRVFLFLSFFVFTPSHFTVYLVWCLVFFSLSLIWRQFEVWVQVLGWTPSLDPFVPCH